MCNRVVAFSTARPRQRTRPGLSARKRRNISYVTSFGIGKHHNSFVFIQNQKKIQLRLKHDKLIVTIMSDIRIISSAQVRTSTSGSET